MGSTLRVACSCMVLLAIAACLTLHVHAWVINPVWNETWTEPTAQTCGAGSYASYPPESVGNDYLNFIFNKTLYVQANESRPIPTNHWWTDLLVEQYVNEMPAYPLLIQGDSAGFQVYFPNAASSDGSNAVIDNHIDLIRPDFIAPNASAYDWNDWGVVIHMPNNNSDDYQQVTLTQGVPFAQFNFSFLPNVQLPTGTTLLNSNGTGPVFPTTDPISLTVGNQTFGLHLPSSLQLDLENQTWVSLDLLTEQTIVGAEVFWETAYASAYSWQSSSDNETWTTFLSVSDGPGGDDSRTFPVPETARYFRLLMSERGTVWPYSILELDLFNASNANVALGVPAYASSEQDVFAVQNLNDGDLGTRWVGLDVEPALVITEVIAGQGAAADGAYYFAISALPSADNLTFYDQFALHFVTNTSFNYWYYPERGLTNVEFAVATRNPITGVENSPILHGFSPHTWKSSQTTANVSWTDLSYWSIRGAIKVAEPALAWSFTYKMPGIVPNFFAPFVNESLATPLNTRDLYELVTNYTIPTNPAGGDDTYWGGKELVNLAKYTWISQQLNHNSHAKLRNATRTALTNWLTYTPGESAHFFARYPTWHAMIGFDSSYDSQYFNDNHFHYGYFTYATAMYALMDGEWANQYCPMALQVAQEYANWDRNTAKFPFFRTFSMWSGFSFAGGVSSATGNNQESSSESMQGWVGLFLLGTVCGNSAAQAAGAAGWVSESASVLEYWFDWEQTNLPSAWAHHNVGIMWANGLSFGTYFSASPMMIWGIEWLPINPGFRYLARNHTWAAEAYGWMRAETAVTDGYETESDFGNDWAQVALGFKLLYDPTNVTAQLEGYLSNASSTVMTYELSGMTYFYAHSLACYGTFDDDYYLNTSMGAVFKQVDAVGNVFARNYLAWNQYDVNITVAAFAYADPDVPVVVFTVGARDVALYPPQPLAGQPPTDGYILQGLAAYASSQQSTAALAIDSDMGTSWQSTAEDNQWLLVDMGVDVDIQQISIMWEVAGASLYYVNVSLDNITWSNVASMTEPISGDHTDVFGDINTTARYIMLDLRVLSTQWGFNIFNVGVIGIPHLLQPTATPGTHLVGGRAYTDDCDDTEVETSEMPSDPNPPSELESSSLTSLVKYTLRVAVDTHATAGEQYALYQAVIPAFKTSLDSAGCLTSSTVLGNVVTATAPSIDIIVYAANSSTTTDCLATTTVASSAVVVAAPAAVDASSVAWAVTDATVISTSFDTAECVSGSSFVCSSSSSSQCSLVTSCTAEGFAVCATDADCASDFTCQEVETSVDVCITKSNAAAAIRTTFFTAMPLITFLSFWCFMM